MEKTVTVLMTEQIQLEKKHWLKKMYYNLDKRRFRNDKDGRDFLIKEVMEIDKCCLIEDYYINTHLPKCYKGTNMENKIELDRKDVEENGLSLYSKSGFGIHNYMINQWYKECKEELLKRI